MERLKLPEYLVDALGPSPSVPMMAATILSGLLSGPAASGFMQPSKLVGTGRLDFNMAAAEEAACKIAERIIMRCDNMMVLTGIVYEKERKIEFGEIHVEEP